MIFMNQADLVIKDFKEQISRLSEERALYFALATSRQQENDLLREEIERLRSELVEKEADDNEPNSDKH